MFTDTLPRLSVMFAAEPKAGALVRAGQLVREAACAALHSHELMLQIEPGRRIRLRCVNCGHQTPGWNVR
jgi:hypothetical protein